MRVFLKFHTRKSFNPKYIRAATRKLRIGREPARTQFTGSGGQSVLEKVDWRDPYHGKSSLDTALFTEEAASSSRHNVSQRHYANYEKGGTCCYELGSHRIVAGLLSRANARATRRGKAGSSNVNRQVATVAGRECDFG